MNKKTKSIILSLGMLLIASLTYSQDPNLHIYLCFGQSNMSGQADFTDADKDVGDRFLVLRASNKINGQQVGELYPAAPPLGHSGAKMGPADFFGRKMVRELPENIKIAVANVAVGDQSIKLFDKDQVEAYVASRNNDWSVQYINQYGGNPYERLVELGEKAKEIGVIKGFLLHQGEADYKIASQWPSMVKKVYEDLLSALDLNAEEVPLLIGEMVSQEEGGTLGSYNYMMSDAVDLIPTAHLIPSEDCPGLPEANYTLHFTRDGYVTLGERYADVMLSLLDGISSSLIVKITSPTEATTITGEESIKIQVTATSKNGPISKVEFYDGNNLLETINSEPYETNFTSDVYGVHSIKAVATDSNHETSSATIKITVSIPQGPYNGIAHAIPGKIEFEEFDVGGNGSAYNDSTTGTEVSPAPNYRTDEDVDIEECSDAGGGYNLGWTEVGEWTEYTVDVKNAGTYTMGLRVACTGTGKTISVESNGNTIANDISIPNTGDWQDWETVSEEVELEAGEQILRFTIGGADYINMNYVEFAYTGDPCADNPYPEVCSCEELVVDLDNDGTPDCADLCPNDSNKTEPGECDCGTPEGECGTAESNMRKGWNLVGYPYDGEVLLETALQSIWDKVEVVKDMDAFYSKDVNPDLNLLKTIKFGYGYFVRVSEPCSLEWGK